ncbi:unnamed protein product [marine sediment metagenome]|uniref:HNH nuclease domain-containing protein n=1 Tax=marine sediment metagenome TaxID=412755 RepID=X1JNQ9_9ZZZZ
MSAPKDPEKCKLWKENLSKSKTGEKNPFYGKHLSQKHKDKISKANSGEKHPMFGKKNPIVAELNKQRIGEKHPMFGKEGVGKGKKRPDLAKRMRGEKHPAYIDGRSYEPYSSEFMKIRRNGEIRRRDGYRCQKCGRFEIEISRKLSIHHIDYNKKNCLPENLISLCYKCNAEVNTNRKKWIKYFQKKMRKIEKGYNQSQLCLARL